MNLLEQSLSALPAGTIVKITQKNGQMLEGTVVQNDGHSALSVQIAAVAVIQYDQVGVLEQETAANIPVTATPLSVPAAEQHTKSLQSVAPIETTEEKPEIHTGLGKIQVPQFTFDEDTLKTIFQMLGSDARKKLNASYNSFLSGLRSHDNEKLDSAANRLWNTIYDDDILYDDKQVNRFYAYICCAIEDYESALISFAVSGCSKEGALAAYHAEYYTDAAAMAADAIVRCTSMEDLPLLFEILYQSTLQCMDIGGFRYVYRNAEGNWIYQNADLMRNCLQRLNQKKKLGIKDFYYLDACFATLQKHMVRYDVQAKLNEYFSESSPAADSTAEKTAAKQPEPTASALENPETKTTDDAFLKGVITRNRWMDEKGVITYTTESGETATAEFLFADITDKFIVEYLKSQPSTTSFHVHFRLHKNKAKDIRKMPATSEQILLKANEAFTTGNHKKALELYQKLFNTSKQQSAVNSSLLCCLTLMKTATDTTYSDLAREILQNYADKLDATVGNYTTLQQTYHRLQMYKESLQMLDKLIGITPEDNHKRRLGLFMEKAKCHRNMNDTKNAIACHETALALMDTYGLIDSMQSQAAYAYAELAELYLQRKDEQKAEFYARKAPEHDRCKAVLEQLKELQSTPETKSAAEPETTASAPAPAKPEPAPSEPEALPEDYSEEEIQSCLETYTDPDGFAALQLTKETALEQAFSFGADKEYCMLTYLSAAAELNDTFVPVSQMVNYAYDNPAADCPYTSEQIASVFSFAKQTMGEASEQFYLSAALRALFYHHDIPDYGLDDLYLVALDTAAVQEHACLGHIMETLIQFRNQTEYGMDAFADYITNPSTKNGNTLEQIVADANACRNAAVAQCERYENVERIRRTRKYILTEDSALRQCLDTVCADDRSKISMVQSVLKETFIRNHHEICASSIDHRKIDAFIDHYWDIAGKQMRQEEMLVERVDLKGKKRQNIICTIERVLHCILEWLDAVKQTNNARNAYALTVYQEMKAPLCQNLQEIIECFQNPDGTLMMQRGAESLVYTAKELLSRLDGSYQPANRTYFFINFLRDNEIMLNHQFLPQLQSTFCILPEFNILARIRRHAQKELLPWDKCIEEAFSSNILTSNFNAMQLLREYAAETGQTEIAEHKMYAYLDSCIKQMKQRITHLHEDFQNELALAQINGRISDVQEERTRISSWASAWYEIAIRTQDFGFYAALLEALNQKISDDAEAYGVLLTRQLESLFANPELEQGIYSKEDIQNFIADQNYTVAENMMNCIRRHDVNEVRDFSMESSSYLDGFLREYNSIFNIVANAKYNLSEAIRRHTSNTIQKDKKGGSRLIENWLVRRPAGKERIENLLGLLGWENCTVTADVNASDDQYYVRKAPQHGRTNYPHPIPAFSFFAEKEGFRVLCLYGNFDCDRLLDTFRNVNTVSLHTIVLLDYSLTEQQRRRLARKIKEEKSFAKTFIVIDRVLLFYLAKHYAANTVNRMLMATALPFAYYQPFVSESSSEFPPELFTGRVAELRDIEAADGANLVYGGRQLGKSALLKMAKKNIDKNMLGDRAIVVDIIGKDYREAAKKVSRELIAAKILDASCECDDWDILTRHIQERLMDDTPETQIHYLLLMLDEGDTFIESCKEINYQPISDLQSIQSSQFKFVIAGLHNLIRFDKKSTLSNNVGFTKLKPLVVSPFKTAEGTELLTHTLGYLGFRFCESETIQQILAQTNYFPGLLQLYCQKLIEAMQHPDYAGYNENYTPAYEITEEHIKRVVSDSTFIEKIDEKLEITLFLDRDQGSYYHIIALIIAYLYYEREDLSDIGYSVEQIQQEARNNSIARLYMLDSDKIKELLNELCALNVLGENAGGNYVFSTKRFRELLGSRKEVENSLAEYIGQEADAE